MVVRGRSEALVRYRARVPTVTHRANVPPIIIEGPQGAELAARATRHDNGFIFTSWRLDKRACLNEVYLDCSRPSEPKGSAFSEAVNGRFRQE